MITREERAELKALARKLKQAFVSFQLDTSTAYAKGEQKGARAQCTGPVEKELGVAILSLLAAPDWRVRLRELAQEHAK